MTANEYANKALTILKEIRDSRGEYYGLGTPDLAHRMGVANTSRDTLLKVLDKLHLTGLIWRKGSGKYIWAIKVETWDPRNPFKRLESAPAAVQNYPTHSSPSSQENSEGESEETGLPTFPSHSEHAAEKRELEELVSALRDKVAEQQAKMEEQEKKASESSRQIKTLKIERYDGTTETLKDVVLPPQFDRVKSLAECRRNILLVGPAGCGKSHLAELTAKVLGLSFGSISCTAGMSEAHLLGRSMPNLAKGDSKFQSTDFLECYENGGVYLFDEFDAADPNLLLCVNTALANGYCNVPNRPSKARAVKHPDFVCIATANTFGRGATRVYSGRNQLDEATLDRFRIGIVEMYYDDVVERHLCPDDTLRTKLQKMRYRIEECGLTRRIMSTRFMRDAYVMLDKGKWSVQQIVDTFFEGWTKDEKVKVEGYSYN